MAQQLILLGGQKLSVDNVTGAVLVRSGGGANDPWKPLRIVTGSDGLTPVTGYAAITTPFCDLRFDVVGSGTCIVEIVEVVAGVGYICKEAFKAGGNSITLSGRCIYKGIAATGNVGVKITAWSGFTSVTIYAREC